MKQWHQLMQKFAGLRPREQLLVAVCGAALLIMLCDQLFWTPYHRRNVELGARIAELNNQLLNVQTQRAAIGATLAQDPDQAVRRDLDNLKTRLSQQNQRLTALTVDLISPQAMADVLRQVLREQRQLQLLELRNEAPTPIFASTQNPDNAADKNRPAIYQHGLTLRLKGRYFEVVNYLHTLENLPWHFYWQHFDYKVGTYPEAEVTVTVYTLSNRESWIGA